MKVCHKGQLCKTQIPNGRSSWITSRKSGFASHCSGIYLNRRLFQQEWTEELVRSNHISKLNCMLLAATQCFDSEIYTHKAYTCSLRANRLFIQCTSANTWLNAYILSLPWIKWNPIEKPFEIALFLLLLLLLLY